ncbi:MAG: hypothetical protein ACLGJB_15490 [Blastocatellia bacterium]
MLRAILGLVFALSVAPIHGPADGGKVEAIGAFSDQAASESVRKALEPKGSRVTLPDGTVACEIWLRTAAPAGKTEAPGAVYKSLAESSLIGVITFPKAASDFRGQSIKPGAYTLRYALHPSDGNHLGISPVRDFLVMIPIGVDQDADARYKFEELVKMSAKASGTNHPAVISLVLTEGKPAPTLVENEHGHLVFVTRIKSQSGADVPIAFVVKGVAEQ